MKRSLLFFLVICCIHSSANSQTVNGIPLSSIDAEYIQIHDYPILLTRKVQVLIDFGQSKRSLSTAEQVIKDSTGKKMNFNSIVEALNFMSANGYEFVQAYGVTIVDKDIEHYFIMRKKTPKIL